MQEPYKEPPPDADSGEDTESEVGWDNDDGDDSSSGSSSSSTDDSRWGLDPSSASSSRVRVFFPESSHPLCCQAAQEHSMLLLSIAIHS